MQPEQQPYSPPPPSHTPDYDFIVNPATAPKKSLIPLPTGGSILQRAAVVGGGLVILLIIIVIFVSLLSGSGNNTTPLVSIAQQQNELIRIATVGTLQTSDQAAKNFAVASQLSLTTDQQQLLTYLKGQGHKVSSKQLLATKSAKTDSELSAAQAASTFDSTFEQIMQTELTTYVQSLKTTFASTTGSNARKLLNNDYAAAVLLEQQLPSSSSSN